MQERDGEREMGVAAELARGFSEKNASKLGG
jgi:hypothetical protein